MCGAYCSSLLLWFFIWGVAILIGWWWWGLFVANVLGVIASIAGWLLLAIVVCVLTIIMWFSVIIGEFLAHFNVA